MLLSLRPSPKPNVTLWLTCTHRGKSQFQMHPFPGGNHPSTIPTSPFLSPFIWLTLFWASHLPAPPTWILPLHLSPHPPPLACLQCDFTPAPEGLSFTRPTHCTVPPSCPSAGAPACAPLAGQRPQGEGRPGRGEPGAHTPRGATPARGRTGRAWKGPRSPPRRGYHSFPWRSHTPARGDPTPSEGTSK